MKCYIIDSEARTITEEHFATMNEAKARAGIEYIESACHTEHGDTFYVDEEGMFPPHREHWFKVPGNRAVLAGNCIVVGREVEDDQHPDGYYNVDPEITLTEIERSTTWYTKAKAIQFLLALDEPAVTVSTIENGNVKVQSRTSWRHLLTNFGYDLRDVG